MKINTLILTTSLAIASGLQGGMATAQFRSGQSLNSMSTKELGDYESIRRVLGLYIEGGRKGKSTIMKPAFHSDALMYGGSNGEVAGGPIARLFEGIDRSPPATGLQAEIVSIDIHGPTASARIESNNWNGARYTDQFLLVKSDLGWKILTKVFQKH